MLIFWAKDSVGAIFYAFCKYVIIVTGQAVQLCVSVIVMIVTIMMIIMIIIVTTNSCVSECPNRS